MIDRFSEVTRIACLAAVLVAGCRSTSPNVASSTTENEHGTVVEHAPIIRAGHVVSVRVMSQNRIEVDERALRVSATGRVTLPLLRDVSLADLTLERAKTVLTGLYAEYVRAPAVAIDFVMPDRQVEMDSPWGYVTLLGCVKRPGQVSIPPTGRLTVTAAIQAVGGTDTGARTSNVQVSRRVPVENEPQTIRLNLHGMDNEKRPAGGLLLRDGDVVFVPEGLF